MKKKIKISDIIIDILLAVSLIILAMAIVVGFKSKENPEDAFLFGYKPVYILTGSMEPTLREHGVCIVQKTTYDEVEVGDIIMYTIEEKTITHRVVEKTEEGIRTKGDNNNVEDAYLLHDENIKAKVVCIFNFTANIVNELQKGPSGYIKVIGYPLLIIIVFISTFKITNKILNKKEDEKFDNEQIEDSSANNEIPDKKEE